MTEAVTNAVPRGGLARMSRRVMNLAHMLTQNARRHGDRVGFVWGEKSWTWREIDSAVSALAAALALPLLLQSRPPRQMEKLGRGLVAIHQDDGKVYVGWRLLGSDPDGIGFNVYRSSDGGAPVKLTPRPIYWHPFSRVVRLPSRSSRQLATCGRTSP